MNLRTKRIISRVGISLVFFLAAAYFISQYIRDQTKKHSPFGTAKYSSSVLDVSVAYCRPYMKGRVIFGTEAEQALQPWGKYWRLGANEATEITFNKNVTFSGKPLDAGTYVMYAVPEPDSWTIGLNTELGRWGYSEVDHDLDVLQVEVPIRDVAPPTEQLTIDFQEKGDSVLLNMKWAQAQATVLIQPI